jgi:hypothetical protein
MTTAIPGMAQGGGADPHGGAVHADVLRTNHVPLLLTPVAEERIANTLPTLGRHYGRYLNSYKA